MQYIYLPESPKREIDVSTVAAAVLGMKCRRGKVGCAPESFLSVT